MDILVGHTNMDLDCLGSLVLARYLFPGFQPVRSRLIHPVAKNLYNMFQNHLNFLPSKDLRGHEIERMKIFDARAYHRVKEYFDLIDGYPHEIDVYDHHGTDSGDIRDAVIHENNHGANTTELALRVRESQITIEPEDATVALTGIFADTGNFSHGNVSSGDFEAASFLMEQGADINLVRHFLKTLKEEYQLSLFHSVLNRLVYQNIHGHAVMVCLMELETQSNGLAAIVEKAFEVENPDALFVIFLMKKEQKTLIVARSQKDEINLTELLKQWGGGGHPRAGSALIKKRAEKEIYTELLYHLRISLTPAVRARELMNSPVEVIRDCWSLLDASLFLEKVQHTGAPVVDPEGSLTGFMTLRDISKGRKQEKMSHSVKAFMQNKVFSCFPSATIRDMESIFIEKNVGHIPVVDSGGQVVGIVTRSDYLDYLKREKKTLAVL